MPHPHSGEVTGFEKLNIWQSSIIGIEREWYNYSKMRSSEQKINYEFEFLKVSMAKALRVFLHKALKKSPPFFIINFGSKPYRTIFAVRHQKKGGVLLKSTQ